MIVTVTLNPAIDKTATISSLCPYMLNRMNDVVTDVGGKGINVSKMVLGLNGSSIATGFVGGGSGRYVLDTLKSMGIQCDFVNVDGTTRTNLKILDKEMRLTEFNEPGVLVNESETDALVKKLISYSNSEAIFVLSGSLCRGLNVNFYADLTRIIHKHGGVVLLDADGEAFRSAVEAKPDFIKPNVHELTEYFGTSEDVSKSELQNMCRSLMDTGISRIALSMGADGAMFFSEDEIIYSPALSVEVSSTVGAGDSMMGAFAYAFEKKKKWENSIRLAMACSAGAVTTKGTKPPSNELVQKLIPNVILERL